MENITFQYYKNDIHFSPAAGWITLSKFLEVNKNPKPEIVDLFRQISEAGAAGDNVTKAKLKEQLYSFTPCVHVTGRRRYQDVIKWTGLLVLDFDKIDNAPDFKYFLFENYDFVIAAWVSPSKKGVKALVSIPIVSNVDDFKSYYYGVAEEMWQYNGFDDTGKNCVLPLFLSYDPELLQRDDYTTWDKKGFMVNSFESAPVKHVLPSNYKPDSDQEKRILNMINKGIDSITGNGHPQLRNLCLAIGGYVAANYIPFDVAFTEIYNKIQTNNYLKKGIPGYQRTAKWALKGGMTKPLILTNNE